VGLFLTRLTSSSPLWVLANGFLPVGGIALPLIPLGFGLGFALSVPTIAVQNEVPTEEVGAAIGLTRFLQSLGGALGISLLTAFETWRFQALSQGVTSPALVTDALVSTYDEVFLILVACIAVAFLFAMFFVGRVPKAETKGEEAGIAADAPQAS
jgi:sugar phosphate permease